MSVAEQHPRIPLSILEHFPDDVWRSLVPFFTAEDVLALFRASNRIIKAKLQRFVTQLRYHNLPPNFGLIKSLNHLTKLVLWDPRIVLDPFALATLPKTLQDLTILHQSAQTCWLKLIDSSLDPKEGSQAEDWMPMFLDEMFPVLHSLRLITSANPDAYAQKQRLSSGYASPGEHFWQHSQECDWTQRLPRALTYLRLPTSNNFSMKSDGSDALGFEYLENLRTLIIDHHLKWIGTEHNTLALPASLEFLTIPHNCKVMDLSRAVKVKELQVGLGYSASTLYPPNLISLSLYAEDSTPPEQIVSALPPTLQRLAILGLEVPREIAASLPRGLKDLKIGSTNIDLKGLPPGLQTLSLGQDSLDTMTHHIMNHAIGWRAFPRVTFGDLPRGLKSLYYSITEFLDDDRGIDMPPNLQFLYLPLCNVTEQWLESLPASLRRPSSEGGLISMLVSRVVFDINQSIVADPDYAVAPISSPNNASHPQSSGAATASSALPFNGTLLSPQAPLSVVHIPNTLTKNMHRKIFPFIRHFKAKTSIAKITSSSLGIFLPSNLGELTIANTETNDLTAITSALPSTLTSLSITEMSSQTLIGPLSKLPESLTRLELGRVDFRDAYWPMRLPRNLRFFSTNATFTLTNQLEGLPRNLISLKCPSATGGDNAHMGVLPRSLKMLQLPSAGLFLTDAAVPLLPPNLTALMIGNKSWSVEALSKLPSSLVVVRIPNRHLNSEQILQLIKEAYMAAFRANLNEKP